MGLYCVSKLFDNQRLNAGVEKTHSITIEKIATNLPSCGFLMDNHNPDAIPIKSKVGENTIAVM